MLSAKVVHAFQRLSVLCSTTIFLILIWRAVFNSPNGYTRTKETPIISSVGHLSSVQRPRRTQSLAKVSMLYGQANGLYERALQSHQRHCDRWNYKMHILREEISAGAGYWNKPNYLISIVLQELAKPKAQRTEWLVWVDADSIILNPAIPLDIFLPPTGVDDIHFIATKDHNGLNTGIIFLHVHPWTVSMLIESIGNPLFHPEVDLGWSADQTSMAQVLAKENGGPDGTGYKRYVTYMPRTLFNAYEFSHGFEGTKGNLLVHFPGLEGERWAHMASWLDIVEGERGTAWEVELEASGYETKTVAFWNKIKEAKEAIGDAEIALASGSKRRMKRDALDKLKRVLWENADDVDLMRNALNDLLSLK